MPHANINRSTVLQAPRAIRSFDGARGVAAMLVVTYHFFGLAAPHLTLYLLVDFFFLLSGFVMTRAYENSLDSIEKIKVFFIRRVGRLYPLHIVTAIICVIASNGAQLVKPILVALGMGHLLSNPGTFTFTLPDPSTILVQIFMLQGIGPLSDFSINGPSWSISTEIFTYLLFAACIFFISRRFRPLVFIALIISGFLIATFNSIHADQCLSQGHCMDVFGHYAIWRCFGGFFGGVMIADWSRHQAQPSKSTLNMIQTIGVAFAAGLMAAGCIPSLFGAAFLVVFAFAAIVWALQWDSGWLADILNRAPFQFLGRLSYSIYLVHAAFLIMSKPITQPSLPVVSKLVAFAAFVTIVIVISMATFRWIEEPCRKAARRWSVRQPVVAGDDIKVH